MRTLTDFDKTILAKLAPELEGATCPAPGHDYKFILLPVSSSNQTTIIPIVDKRIVGSAFIGNTFGYTLFLYNGKLSLQLADAPFSTYVPTTGLDLCDGNFHHVAVTVYRNNPDGIRFYVDGNQYPNMATTKG